LKLRKRKGQKISLEYDPKSQKLSVKADPKDLPPSKIIRLLLAGVTLMGTVLTSEMETEPDQKTKRKRRI